MENLLRDPSKFVFRLPGNTRTKIGFITFDSTIHFYSLQEGLSQPQMLIVSDIEGIYYTLKIIAILGILVLEIRHCHN